jgi:hypothetical protein
MIKEDILEKFLKIVFLKTKILSFGVYLNQKKMYLEDSTYKKKTSRENLFL